MTADVDMDAFAPASLLGSTPRLLQVDGGWKRTPLVSTALIAMALLGGFPARAQSTDKNDKRIALVISNESYPDADPGDQKVDGDARALVAQLKRNGFETDLSVDLNKHDMDGAINAFLAKVVPKSTVFLYYKGVGIQVAHQTFIVPIDALIWSEADVRREGANLETLVNEINKRGAAIKVIVVDAARSNPFERRFRNSSAGLAGIDVPEGSLVIFSNAPNKIAPEEHGPNSLFMKDLVAEMGVSGITAEDAFTQTRIKVSRASDGREVPWVTSSLVEPFFFGQSGAEAARSSDRQRSDGASPAAAAAGVIAPGSATTSATTPAPAQGGGRAQPSATVAAAVPREPPAAPPRPQSSPASDSPPDRPTVVAMVPTADARLPAGKAAVFTDCPQCPEMVSVPQGSFQMGSGTTPFDRPSHRVTLAKPFALGTSLVTYDQWTACADDGGCKTRPDAQGGGGTHPVVNVSWLDAKEYTAWLSAKAGKTYRLPSEAEWEYAAHGGTTTPFSWGPSVGVHMANCTDCGGATGKRRTDPVKTYAPNAFGLYDMAGNAAEWIEDCWNPSYRNAPKDGSAWETGGCGARVLRGGSFSSTSAYIKPTARFRYDADVRYQANGFRVARDLP